MAPLVRVSFCTQRGCGFNLHSGGYRGENGSLFLSHTDVPQSLSLSFPLSLKSINISSREDFKNKSIKIKTQRTGNK